MVSVLLLVFVSPKLLKILLVLALLRVLLLVIVSVLDSNIRMQMKIYTNSISRRMLLVTPMCIFTIMLIRMRIPILILPAVLIARLILIATQVLILPLLIQIAI